MVRPRRRLRTTASESSMARVPSLRLGPGADAVDLPALLPEIAASVSHDRLVAGPIRERDDLFPGRRRGAADQASGIAKGAVVFQGQRAAEPLNVRRADSSDPGLEADLGPAALRGAELDHQLQVGTGRRADRRWRSGPRSRRRARG